MDGVAGVISECVEPHGLGGIDDGYVTRAESGMASGYIILDLMG